MIEGAPVAGLSDLPERAPDILPHAALGVLDRLPAPVVTCAADGTSLVVNEAFRAVTGYGFADLRGRTVDDLFSIVGCTVEWRRVASGASSRWGGAAILLGRDGVPLHVRVDVVAILLTSGQRLLWSVEDRSAAYWECPSTWGG
ncbi:PAS domain-containing protein [Tomitella gaofuii]|uniref:PAS domain-containing protein n=1 Tax=Tomitella gaofuii TaxID=2760083 RepID=UPI0015FA408B|nr:PAS domain-containing protein [Tomitella gaofuii]